MHASAETIARARPYPVTVTVADVLRGRSRLTTFFRPLLALPHLLLVGGPIAIVTSVGWSSTAGWTWEWTAGSGALGAVALVCALIAWFALVFTGRHPRGLWDLAAFYLRWRVRAIGYLTLLSDEYPAFGDAPYPIRLALRHPRDAERDRLSVAFRPLLVVPHLIVLWFLGLGWVVTTLIGWIWIVVNGRFPTPLYHYGSHVLEWGARVEAYLLLLRDEYPPFSFS